VAQLSTFVVQLSTVVAQLSKFFYSPTDAPVNCVKNHFKIYIEIDNKTAPTYFGAVAPSSGSVLLVLAIVTVVKIVYVYVALFRTVQRTHTHTHYFNNCNYSKHQQYAPYDGATAPKYVGAVLLSISM